MLTQPFPAVLLLVASSLPCGIKAQDAAAESAARTVELERLDGAVYHLLDAKADELPRRGAALLIVLPGGDGGWDDARSFLPFVENGIHGRAVPEDTVTALGVARRWHPEQEVVWPLDSDQAEGAEYTALDYVDAMIADVGDRVRIDRRRVHVLAWSSSGPLAYAALLRRRSPLAGAYVAMSVYRDDDAARRFARGKRLVLDQSPEDRVTPFRFAREAHERLSDARAEVWLRAYRGGHGWHDAPLPRIAVGLRWLRGDADAPDPQYEIPAASPVDGENLLTNGSFEDGTSGWLVLNNSGRMTAEVNDDDAADGDRSLVLHKTGAVPLDLVRQDVDLRGAVRVRVSCWTAAEGAGNAFVKFFAYDENDEPLHSDVDVVHLRGDRDGAVDAKSWELGGEAVRGTLMIVMVLGGEVRVDDLRVVVERDPP
jgi:predicted esterase